MPNLQILTCREVAELLRVTEETVHRLAIAGNLPGRKFGRVWRFPKSAIEAHVLMVSGSIS